MAREDPRHAVAVRVDRAARALARDGRVARRQGRAGDAPEGPAWRSELDAIDEAMWRRLRRELYGGPDCGAPSSLRRFEEYCGLRRANVADDFRVVDGGRRAIYLEEQYPNLTARAIWDAGDFGWIERVVARVPDLREEVAGRALGWREGKWVDTYGHDGAYDSGWGMVHLRDDRFPRATRALALSLIHI